MTWRELLRRLPRLLADSAPGWTVAATLLMLLEVASGLASLYLLKRLVDAATAVGQGAGGGLQAVLSEVVLTGTATLVFVLSRAAAAYAREAQGVHVGDHVDRLVHAKATDADLAFYESPRYFDTLERARQTGLQRPAQVVANLLLFGKNAVMLAAAVAMIASLNALVLPVLAGALVPALLVRMHFARAQYDWQQRRTQLERRAGYLDWLMTSDHHAKELRINRLGVPLMARYAGLREQIRSERLSLAKRRTTFDVVAAAGAAVAFFGSLAFLARETAEGRGSIGDLVLFIVVFQRAQGVGQEMVAEAARLYEDKLYLGLLFGFLDLKSQVAAPEAPVRVPRPVQEGIRLHSLSFCYPGASEWALRDISLEIKPGQVVALVGANGSGKTSLIKVLTRLYDPTEGHITVDGVDARLCDPEEYRSLYSVIFQDFSRYAETVRENVRFGDPELPPDSLKIVEALRASGAEGFVRELPESYDTRLTRLFDDGHEISVGQWQKVALARAFVRQSQLVILDEPTSALDPEAEHELFEDFRGRIGGRMALVISHRLSTVRMADVIYVMDGGHLVEGGTHDALMARRGRYFELFSKQAKHYRPGDGEVVT